MKVICIFRFNPVSDPTCSDMDDFREDPLTIQTLRRQRQRKRTTDRTHFK